MGLLSKSVEDLSATETNTASGISTTTLQNSTISTPNPLTAAIPGFKGQRVESVEDKVVQQGNLF